MRPIGLLEEATMVEAKSYVRLDPDGVMRVGTTRVTLDSIIASFEQGHSAESIQQQYPAPSLEEIYGAITYYLAHREEVEDYLRRQGQIWELWRAKAADRA